MQPDQEVINRWTGSAPYWEKHRAPLRQMFAPVTIALAEAASISPRQIVLDLATGPGEPALSLSTLVGPEGKVGVPASGRELVSLLNRLSPKNQSDPVSLKE